MYSFNAILHFAIIVLAGQATARVISNISHLQRRDGFDVNRFAYLGDSFAAGPGAGEPYGDATSCQRTEQAWGPLVAGDPRLHGPKPIGKFDFIACSGAKTKDIHKGDAGASSSSSGGGQPEAKQASLLNGTNPELVTMSIGGNDVGFVDLLDRCVYRFYSVGCGGCGSWFSPFDDCSADCDKAISELQENIDKTTFTDNYRASVIAIFENAPTTHLFVTGYPRFWNAETADCDNVSFKFGCTSNRVVPVTRDRRAKMNQLTLRLNEKIQSIVTYNVSDIGSVTYVDPDPHFEGHRFCEAGVKEPSYRNDNIWFFPFEYYANTKLLFNADKQIPSEDCHSILEKGGDNGAFFACQIANTTSGDSMIDLQAQPNNVQSSNEPPIVDSKGLPGSLTRIFHPTSKGHQAYREAFFTAYNAYQPREAPALRCKGLQSKQYFSKGPISDLITNTYCPKLAGMTSTVGGGVYLTNTPEQVDIFAGPSTVVSQGVPTPEQCIKNLHLLLDQCDTDASANPMEWKAGGEVDVDGWTYSITTQHVRPPAPKRPSAWCQLEKCNSNTGCTARIWGAGWLNSGFGHELREAFELDQTILKGEGSVLGNHKGIDVSLWGETFLYEAMDLHEWTVTLQMDTGIFLDDKTIVLETLRSVANSKDPTFLDVSDCRIV